MKTSLIRLFALLLIASLSGTAQAQRALPIDTVPSGDVPVFSIDSPLGPIAYHVGRGMHFGRSGLRIGGFSIVEIDREEADPGSFELDGVNFLVSYEPLDWFRLFAEVEIGGLFTVALSDFENGSNPNSVIERLYFDVGRSDSLNLRLGKFQTPVGRWNLVPAEPFVWTANQPLITEEAFDEHQTGGAVFGSIYRGSRTLNYWLYGQFVDPLDADHRDSDPVDRSVGGRVEYGGGFGAWSVGTSLLASERNERWSYLGGLDALWQIGPLELSTEFVAQKGEIPGRDVWGIYLQGVYDVGSLHECLQSLYFVGRFEHFDPEGSEEEADLWDLGLTWIPKPYLNIKATYRLTDHQTEAVRRGLTASISVLF